MSTEMIPRNYQIEIENISLECNSIIYLPTGSGKTFIAIRIIKKLQKSTHLPFSQGGKRTFFLVNTVPLVYQHVKVIETLTSLTVKSFSGQDKVDLWDEMKWKAELENTQILVMTTQILLDMLLHSYIELEQINLMIFDECHSAVENHPMRQIMALYKNIKIDQRPRVIGLTATLINKNIKPGEVENTIRSLESTFHAKICTSNQLEDILRFSTDPSEIVTVFGDMFMESKVILEIKHILNEFTSILNQVKTNVTPDSRVPGYTEIKSKVSVAKKLKKIKESIIRNLEDFGILGGSLALMCTIVKLERIKLTTDVDNHPLIQAFITNVTKCRAILEKHMAKEKNEIKINQFSSPKVLLLLRILKEYSNNCSIKENKINKNNESLCGIIFVKERTTALVLYTLLKFVKNHKSVDYEFLKHDFITGFNSNPYNDNREELYLKKKNLLVISKFKCGLVNCLISTDIIEEGFDLPDCNLVIRFDKLLTIRSYVQSKGRGRNSNASYVIMIPKSDENKFRMNYQNFKDVNLRLKKILVESTDIRIMPSEEEIKESFDSDENSYSYKNAVITINSAISLLNRYCSNLPHDMFTLPQPRWLYKKTDENCIISVLLPVNCPLKKIIEGPPSANLKLAKQRAALEACKLLHRLKELNDNLLPNNKMENTITDDINERFFSHWNKLKADLKSKNENKPSSSYFKKFPNCFNGPDRSNLNQLTFFLQVIKIIPKSTTEIEETKEIYKMIESKSGYAIITHKKMYPLCPFAIFNSSGEYTVHIETAESVTIKPSQLELIKSFNLLVFFNILKMKQCFATYDSTKSSNYLFIVPVNQICDNKFSIDWNVMNNCKFVEEIREPSIDERQNMNITTEGYLHHIVTPWYRSDYDCRSCFNYVVTNVCHELSPYSPFPSDNYSSFAQYYFSKYQCKIECKQNQPLLKAKPIGGNKMNCLIPRIAALSVDGSLSKRKLKSIMDTADNTTYESLLFIPEFCTRFSFPGVLWLKATMLPSIIHRITMLLQAEDLRREIVKNAQIGSIESPAGYTLSTMGVDFHALKKSQKLALVIESSGYPKNEMNECIPFPQDSPKKNSLKVSYEITKKNIDEEFPWKPDLEPIDIYRNIETTSVINIECYERFLNEKVTLRSINSPEIFKTVKTMNHSSRAICAPPFKYDSNINLINKKETFYGPEMKSILAALTIARSNDVFNLERYEILGDSFLKFSTSFFLLKEYPQFNEGQLTALKGTIVSNRNLQLCGEVIDLPSRMKVKQFQSLSDWMPPGMHLPDFIYELIGEQDLPNALCSIYLPREEVISGNLSNNTKNYIMETFETAMGTKDFESLESYFGKQTVRHKEIADCVEALIGVYIVDGGVECGFKILNWLKILPTDNEILNIMKNTRNNSAQQSINMNNVDFLLDYNRNKIETILGYKFKDPSLLLEALSHASNTNNQLTECYQRLEFLGDAILDFLITCYIYEHFESLSPGDITDLRSALVNNVTFACIIVRLGLHKYILSSNLSLDNAISKFVTYQNQRGHIIDETVLFLLEEDNCSIANYVDVPKVLGDIFESLAGAIFLDCGNNLQILWNIFYKLMHKEIFKFSENIPKQPVRLIYEKVHAAPQFMPSIVSGNGRVMVPLRINVNGKTRYVHGFGQRRKDAKRSAAKIALKILDD